MPGRHAVSIGGCGAADGDGRKYYLDKMYPQIIKELNEREAKRAQANEQ